ncbi:MAG TPA: zf-HC2 domain-containing protein [Bryobacteraceae bacterium]|jgi:anti-sigma factor RsiW|nr:zf-HC2 domain-containing protein [Bryobacteraceae bacterium]
MNCPLQREETQDLLLDYSAGRLDAARAAMLEQHTENCAACSTFLADQAAVWSTLDVWEPMPASMDFNRRLWQRIDAAATAPWYRTLVDSLRFGGWKPVFPLAVAILVIAGGFLMDHPGGVPAVSPPTAQGVSFSEADQLEQTLDDIQLLRQLDSVAPSSDTTKPM